MEYSIGIDTLAFAGKLAVENSKLNRNSKEWAKLGIEGAQILLKSMPPLHTSDMSVMGFTLDEIARIKETARCYGLKRVVLFPCNVNGRVHSFFRMYEGNIEAFCVKLGITRFSDSISASEEALIDELIKTYGIIVYERD